ncbi:Ger(x)C family spore germination protein [Paenibacillus sp. CF384]|uniref:Ger(x)C family spore germination protein n=1 Tax=Paenibacillus sp. CF384 TaxID=1884382 RepID=UPI0008995E2F|nr:Ger(x)C family spore germination protein [Paenibacillus sp. CF384]SDX15444.1 spore germination protein [Paenibacillus sp. CF384]
MNKRIRNRVGKLLLAALTVASLIGCGDQRVLEKLGFSQVSSYDLKDNNMLEVAVSMPKAEPQARTQREVLSAIAVSSKEARSKLAKQTNLLLVSGQLRNTLYSMALARNGLEQHMDTLVRDPSISPRIKISIVNGNAKQMLEKEYKQHPITGKYIDGILEKEATGRSIPQTSLYSFMRDLYDDGIDPVAPVLRDAGEHINIDGVGLFREDRYITMIRARDGLIFSFLKESFKRGEISIHLTGEENERNTITLSSLTSRKKVKVGHDASGLPTLHIQIQFSGTVLEYTGKGSLSEAGNRKRVEQQIAKQLTARGQKLIDFMQKNRVDSLGMGISVRNRMSYAAWQKLNWMETYPSIQATCGFTAVISNTGKAE